MHKPTIHMHTPTCTNTRNHTRTHTHAHCAEILEAVQSSTDPEPLSPPLSWLHALDEALIARSNATSWGKHTHAPHTHTHTHTHIHTQTHTHTPQTQTDMYTHIGTHTQLLFKAWSKPPSLHETDTWGEHTSSTSARHSLFHSNTHVCIHTHSYTNTHSRIGDCSSDYENTRLHSHTQLHKHTHTHTHTHTHSHIGDCSSDYENGLQRIRDLTLPVNHKELMLVLRQLVKAQVEMLREPARACMCVCSNACAPIARSSQMTMLREPARVCLCVCVCVCVCSMCVRVGIICMCVSHCVRMAGRQSLFKC